MVAPNWKASCADNGKFLGSTFDSIPVKVLLRVYFNNEYKNCPSMFQFAKDNLDVLLDMAKTTYVTIVIEEADNNCVKIKYVNKILANKELKKIRSYIADDYKPVRSYYCDNCSMWHLTSKSNVQLEKFEKP